MSKRDFRTLLMCSRKFDCEKRCCFRNFVSQVLESSKVLVYVLPSLFQPIYQVGCHSEEIRWPWNIHNLFGGFSQLETSICKGFLLLCLIT